jgi:hypothetical protein
MPVWAPTHLNLLGDPSFKRDSKALQISRTLVALIFTIIALRNSFDEKGYEIILFNRWIGAAKSKING